MEEWREIKGLEQYQVSNLGNVRNKKTNKLLKYGTDRAGYLKVYLYKSHEYGEGQERSMFYVHRLVATYFLQQNSEKTEVNHIDGNVKNNNVTNLEWVTPQENRKHFLFDEKMKEKREKWRNGYKSREKLIEYKGHVMNISNWCKFLGLKERYSMYGMIKKHSIEYAIDYYSKKNNVCL